MKKMIALLLMFILICAIVFSINVSAKEDEYGLSVVRKIADEGIVLLKNENALPFDASMTVALFGEAQLSRYDDTVNTLTLQRGYIPFGSGSSKAFGQLPQVAPLDAFREAQSEGRIKIYEPLSQKYENDIDYQPDDAMYSSASENADAAVMFIRRWGGECRDFKKADWDLTSEERTMLNKLNTFFKKVVVVLNTGCAIDTSWSDEVDALLFAGYGGMQGGYGIADVLTGKENPSGKLVTTYAKALEDYPTNKEFFSGPAQNYTEDIFLGYRYFETFDKNYQKVNYEFGFGLSYTSFELTLKSFDAEGDSIKLSVSVKNTGLLAGKETVQIYFSAPEGKLGKAAKELCAFDKTDLLQPGEDQTLSLSFAKSDMSAYDDTGKTGNKSAFVLEQGDYRIFFGTSVKNVTEAGTVTVDQDTVTKQLTEQMKTNLAERLLASGETEKLDSAKVKYSFSGAEAEQKSVQGFIKLTDVTAGKATLDDFVSQMSKEELLTFCVSYPGNTFGADDFVQVKYGINRVKMVDGPSGLGGYGSSFPCETVLACTWNLRLAEAMGLIVGYEGYTNNVDMWLAPGLNLHRHPLSGRNFEYFSEDPLIAGSFGSAIVKASQSMGLCDCVKHFVCNERETDKLESDSRVSERALRELYLAPFETVITEAHPVAVMSSYNSVNGVASSENYSLLVNILRREWGFEGVVTGDWNNNKDAVREINGGNGIREPYTACDIEKLKASIDKISRTVLEETVKGSAYAIMHAKSFVVKNETCQGHHSFKDGICTVCYGVDPDRDRGAEIDVLLNGKRRAENVPDKENENNPKIFTVGTCCAAVAVNKKRKNKVKK